jgi:hypothetical protein
MAKPLLTAHGQAGAATGELKTDRMAGPEAGSSGHHGARHPGVLFVRLHALCEQVTATRLATNRG